MVVGEFDYIEKKENGIQFRVYTPVGKSNLGEFALNFSVKSLAYFEKMFDIKYPLPKLDLISIPDFEATAMENWGAVTFRENALLVDPKNTALSTKHLVSIVISHELGHMWFGDLCTMVKKKTSFNHLILLKLQKKKKDWWDGSTNFWQNNF